ncbi:MAG: hypothetical protein DRQ39_02750 [Gammaproteobacteria bacterium]|nr:MAG: hypothetical protein DRQ39_02750 [Gammaproteobacteria bacterium]
MKKCSMCKLNKPFGEFNKHKRRKDGYQSQCKPCGRLRSRQRYKENSEHHKQIVQNNRIKFIQKSREYVWNWLKDHSCIDCGEDDIVVLEFDHQQDKELSISRAIATGWSIPRIQKEIAKCEVRCANCHRRKTAKDFNWRVLNMGS